MTRQTTIILLIGSLWVFTSTYQSEQLKQAHNENKALIGAIHDRDSVNEANKVILDTLKNQYKRLFYSKKHYKQWMKDEK